MNEVSAFQGQDSPIRMLLVEDSQHDADFIAMMLKRSPGIMVDIDHVSTLGEAVAASRAHPYDIVLLDLGLPDSTGTESVSRLKACAPTTPIVVLTGDDRDATANAAIISGAQDYLPKQHVVGQLLTRMMKHSIARHSQLVRAQSEALVDGLTGLANRRACEAELDRRFLDYQRHRHPFCIAVFDIDFFKKYNDRWGHEVGDQVIQQVADTLAANVRQSDFVSRYGGEEFAVVLQMTRLQDALDLRDNATLRSVSYTSVSSVSASPPVPASRRSGPMTMPGRFSLVLMMRLYAAKRAGRNCCVPALDEAETDGSKPIHSTFASDGN